MSITLLASILAIAATHVLGGLDHWLPFVALAKALRWRWPKLLLVVLLGGIGHVGSSIAIGLAGIAVGLALKHLKVVEEMRSEIAGWLLVAFGVIYALWGVWRARKKEIEAPSKAEMVTTWTIVLLLVLGPCEPLIPLMFLATQYGWAAVWLVSFLFSIVTVSMMLAIVSALYSGLVFLLTERVERWTHALAGAIIAATGLAVMLFGL